MCWFCNITIQAMFSAPVAFVCRPGSRADFIVLSPDLLVSLTVTANSSLEMHVLLLQHRDAAACTVDIFTCVVFCRPGLRADFTVFKADLLASLTGAANLVPEVSATFVDGACAFGCSNFHAAPKAALMAAA